MARQRRVSIGAVVLAAGASSRLGRPKQLLGGPRGTLVAATIAAARDAGASPIVVTVGAHAEQVRPACGGAHIVDVPDWAAGQHVSVAAGVRALQAMAPTLDAVLLLVCDQPALDAAVLVRLEDAFRRTGAQAAAAFYDSVAGVPALVSRALLPRLLEPPGVGGSGVGARGLLRDPAVRTALVEWPEGAFDVDTPEDAAALAAWRPATPGATSA